MALDSLKKQNNTIFSQVQNEIKEKQLTKTEEQNSKEVVKDKEKEVKVNKEGKQQGEIKKNTTMFITAFESRVTKFLDGLDDTTKDLQELREMADKAITQRNKDVDDYIEKFLSLDTSINKLIAKMQNNLTYEEYLKQCMRSSQLETEKNGLLLALNEEKSEVNMFIKRTDMVVNKLKESIDKTTDSNIRLTLTAEKFSEEANNDREEFKQEASNKISQFEDTAINKMRELIEKVGINFENMKKGFVTATSESYKDITKNFIDENNRLNDKCISYLNDCKDINKKLVEQYPVLNKLNKKDLTIYAIGIFSIISLIVQIIFH